MHLRVHFLILIAIALAKEACTMQAIRHRSTNGILRPPKDTPPEVFKEGSIPLTTLTVSERFTAMKTYWRPSEEDISNILAGGLLELTIYGKLHPVIGLKITMP